MSTHEQVARLASTGIAGLDDVLGGGLTPERLYLVEGTPGTGKTTLGLGFLLAGAAEGEPGLYVTLSETEKELRAVAATHGWSLDALQLYELVPEAASASIRNRPCSTRARSSWARRCAPSSPRSTN
jgi:circadian clock protein KaiC